MVCTSSRILREKDIELNLIKKVKQVGGIAYKFVSPGRIGVPDRIVLLPNGEVIFVECKAPGQKPRSSQLREHERIRALGRRVVIIDSYDLSSIFG